MRAIYQSPIGAIALKSTFNKINELKFIDDLSVTNGNISKNASLDSNTLLALKELDLYFEGKLKSFKCEFEILGASAFEMAIYKALLGISYAKSCTYKALCTGTGYERAYRAAGNALGKNPIAIIVPCHRVLGVSSLGGYASGLWRKEYLLKLQKG